MKEINIPEFPTMEIFNGRELHGECWDCPQHVIYDPETREEIDLGETILLRRDDVLALLEHIGELNQRLRNLT